jgi:hypothetical protein
MSDAYTETAPYPLDVLDAETEGRSATCSRCSSMLEGRAGTQVNATGPKLEYDGRRRARVA